MLRQFLFLPLLLLTFTLSAQRQAPAATTSATSAKQQSVQGFFTPKKNCTSCEIKVITHNGRPAVKAILGCSHKPYRVKINGTVIDPTDDGGGSYHAILENVSRGSFHVSVRSQWLAIAAFYSEGGADVHVPQDVSSSVSLTDAAAVYCPGNSITARASVRHATRTSYTFRQPRNGGGEFTLANFVISGNTPPQVDINALYRAQTGQDLPAGTHRVTVRPGNVVSTRVHDLNFRVRTSSLDPACRNQPIRMKRSRATRFDLSSGG